MWSSGAAAHLCEGLECCAQRRSSAYLSCNDWLFESPSSELKKFTGNFLLCGPLSVNMADGCAGQCQQMSNS